jgi:hypothetical protein
LLTAIRSSLERCIASFLRLCEVHTNGRAIGKHETQACAILAYAYGSGRNSIELPSWKSTRGTTVMNNEDGTERKGKALGCSIREELIERWWINLLVLKSNRVW